MGTTNFGSGLQYYLTTYANGALTVNTALPDLDPVAINNAGQITGVQVSKCDSFLSSRGTLTTISNQPNVIVPVTRGMNPSGPITGVFFPFLSAPQQSFLFSNGQFMPLATPGTYAIVGSINDSGVIAESYGVTPSSSLKSGVFVYDASGFHSLGRAMAEFLQKRTRLPPSTTPA